MKSRMIKILYSLLILLMMSSCVYLIGIQNSIKIGGWFLVILTPLILGGYYLNKLYPQKPITSILLWIGLLGIVFFSATFYALIFDEKSARLTLSSKFLISICIGFIVALFAFISSGIAKILNRSTNKENK